jgi:hypothetical protein
MARFRYPVPATSRPGCPVIYPAIHKEREDRPGLAGLEFASILPSQMLRKSGLKYEACVAGVACMAAVLLWGCDLFSTREFRSKPSEIRTLSGLRHAGDSVSFRSTESVWKTGGTAPETVLSTRRLVFILDGDSLDGGDTLKRLILRIREDSSGVILETVRRLVRFSSQGVVLEGSATGGGARYFPLKATAETAAAEAAPAAPDSTAILALPGLLVEGWTETRAMGILTVTRRQTSIDTLAYQDRDEEVWVIRETVGDGSAPLSTGDYRYGASGLLRVEQTWAGFGWRSENGAVPAKAADGGPAETELRRIVVRL